MSEAIPDYQTYSEMFSAYLGGQEWITASELPLVHHIRKLCAQLDNAGMDKAAMSSAYLQAVERLEKRRPSAKTPSPGGDGDPDQSSIFDFID